MTGVRFWRVTATVEGPSIRFLRANMVGWPAEKRLFAPSFAIWKLTSCSIPPLNAMVGRRQMSN
jgi:hypothetical protein